MVTLYTVTLTVACCVAVALVIGSERRGRPVAASGATPSTFAVLAAACATLSTIAYAMTGPNDENTVPLVIADISMPLSIGLLLATVRLAAGKKRTLAPYATIVSFGVGATTLLISPDAGQAVKLLALTLFSWMCAYTCLRGGLRPRGAWLIGGATALYGAYCLVRFAGPLVGGPIGALVEEHLGRGTSTIVAAGTVAIVSWGVIEVIRRPRPAELASIVTYHALADWIGALLAQRSEVTAIAASIPDLILHRAAFGRAWALSSLAAATRATRAGMPAGSVVGRVAPGVLVALQFSTVVDLESIRSRVQESYTTEFADILSRDTELADAGLAQPPELRIELLTFSAVADLRRFARQARSNARHAMSSQRV